MRRMARLGGSWLVATSLWGIPLGVSEALMVAVFAVWLALVVALA
jgi:hypothetical protein